MKLADLDRNNDSNSEDGERDAVADEVAASVKIYGIFSTINVKPSANAVKYNIIGVVGARLLL